VSLFIPAFVHFSVGLRRSAVVFYAARTIRCIGRRNGPEALWIDATAPCIGDTIDLRRAAQIVGWPLKIHLEVEIDTLLKAPTSTHALAFMDRDEKCSDPSTG
jgi:hypothetical protein